MDFQCRVCRRWLDFEDRYGGRNGLRGDICYECYYDLENKKECDEYRFQKLLDATSPWYPCSNCGKETRNDKLKSFNGVKICEECAKKVKECQICHKKYVMEKRKVLYTKDESFTKRKDEIEYKEFVFGDNTPYAGEVSARQYDAIKRNLMYMCPTCFKYSKEHEPDRWETSHKLKAEYDRLKAAKEKADKDAEEQAQRDAERKEFEERIRKRNEEMEAEEKLKKNEKRLTGGCVGVFLLVAVLLLAYFKDGNMVAAAIVGVAALVLSIVFNAVTTHLFYGLVFGLAFTFVFGLIISAICWFAKDMFLAPLLGCFVVSTILGAVLNVTGLLDKMRNRG